LLDPLRELAHRIGGMKITPGFDGPSLLAHEAMRHLAHAAGVAVAEPVDFWTEASLFAEAGIPAMVVGPGDIQQAHTPDEWVAIPELCAAVEAYTSLARAVNMLDTPSDFVRSESSASAHSTNFETGTTDHEFSA
jgi:acetylornithine deacetylase